MVAEVCLHSTPTYQWNYEKRKDKIKTIMWNLISKLWPSLSEIKDPIKIQMCMHQSSGLWPISWYEKIVTLLVRHKKGATYSILLLTIRGGVPVRNRSILKPSCSIVLAKPIDALSPILPAGRTFIPICISPLRNVPAVKTTLLPLIVSPFDSTTPEHLQGIKYAYFFISIHQKYKSFFL